MFGQGASFPTVSNGYLLSFSRKANVTQPHRFIVTSLLDGKQQSVQFSLKQPYSFIEDASINASGHILVAASYVRSSDGSPTNVFADLDPSAKESFLVNLGDYSPERICGGPDGTVWMLGQRWASEGSVPVPDYSMLRSYTSAGAAKGSYFERSTLGFSSAINFHKGERATPAFLACGDASVGAYIGVPGTGVGYWAEVQKATGDLRLWTVPVLRDFRMTGIALLGSHAAYASFVSASGERRLYRLGLNGNGSASWNPIALSEDISVHFGGLVGRDGNQLVYFTANRTAGEVVLHWSSLQP
ncbi:MAG TPA: hypothetical protein VHU83_14375 [Bryobacteraceae bacterium]|jgi:hypothetical protein|nr:hypothetical protein [Bryobacteraceae bacterium]